MELAVNLKRLRKVRDMTQEDLAELLGVTAQAVSKWERGESYPDITLLPAIAAHYGVSIEDLLGVNGHANKEKRDAVLKKWQEMILPPEGVRAQAADYLREQLRDFPQDWDLWIKLGFCLDGTYESGLPVTTEADHREALGIYERVLKFCIDDTIRMQALRGLINVYVKLGEIKRAIEAAGRLPSMTDARELILPSLHHDEQKIQSCQYALTVLACSFITLTRTLAADGNLGYAIEERIRILEKGIALNKLMTDEGDKPFLPGYIMSSYFAMADLSMAADKPDRAFDYLDSAADYAILWLELGREHQYASVLQNRRNRSMQWALDLQHNLVDELYFTLTTTDNDKKWPALDKYGDDARLLRIIEKLKPHVAI